MEPSKSQPLVAGDYQQFWNKLDEYGSQASEGTIDVKQYFQFLDTNQNYIGDAFIKEKLQAIAGKITQHTQDDGSGAIGKIMEITEREFETSPEFPKELWGLVMTNLEPADLSSAGQVSKGWRELLINQINNNPDTPITEFGAKNVQDVLKLLSDGGGDLVTSLNLSSLGNISPEEFISMVDLCPNLKSLSFESSHSGETENWDAALEHLKGKPLQELNVPAGRFSDNGLAHLTGLPIQKLNLKNCWNLTADGLKHLQGMPLTELNIANTHLYEGFEHLKEMPLKKIDMSQEEGLEEWDPPVDDAIQHLVDMELTHVNFYCCCNGFTDKSLEYLKGMPLVEADFSMTFDITDKGVENLVGMPLQKISFFNCRNLTDKTLELCKEMPLKEFKCNGCINMSRAAVESFKEKL